MHIVWPITTPHSVYTMSQQSSIVNPWNNVESLKAYCKNDKLMYTSTKTSHRRKVLCLEWSVDGKYLASGSQDSTTCIYKLDTEKSFTVKL